MAEGSAPRSSELRRSDDYSGPSSFSGRLLRPFRAARRVVPVGVVPLRYGAPVTDLPRAVSTTPSAPRSRAAPGRSRSSPARVGQDPRAHPSHRVAGAARARSTRTTCSRSRSRARPRASSRTRLARLGVQRIGHRRHVPRHRARAAAPPLPKTPASTMPAHARAQGARARAARQRTRPRGRARAPPSSRPRSSGRRRGSSRPDGYETRGHRRGRALPRARPPRSPTSTASTSARSAAGARRLRRPHLAAAPTRSSATPTSPPRNAGGSATSSSTSSRTRARHSSGCCARGSATAPISASSATATRRSTGSPAPTPTFSCGSPQQFPPERFPDVGVVRSAATTAPPRRSSRPRARCSAPRAAAAPRCARPGPTAPRHVVTEYDTDDAEARGVAARGARRARIATLPWRASPCSTGSTRSRRSSKRRSAVPACRSASAAAGGSSSGPKSRSRSTRSARRPAPHRAAPFARAPHRSHVVHRRRAVGGAARAHRRGRAPRPRVPRRRGRPGRLASGSGSVDGFLAYLQTALRGDDAEPAGDDTVELLTFHRAKGLEFDTVFVTGLERGLVPISHAKTIGGARRGAASPLRRAEPGRARAAAELGAHTHHRAAAIAKRTPSPWLARVERAHRRRRSPRPRPSTSTPRAIADARSRDQGGGTQKSAASAQVADADAPLFAALVEWRLQAVARLGRARLRVFTTPRSRTIATARPRTGSRSARRSRASGRSRPSATATPCSSLVARAREPSRPAPAAH